nr:MAG TPA: hypothetical protein [Bacteriophage sp.]
MDTKKLKINIPEGYEVDKEKSTFEEIVFKKINPLTKLPKTWKEYCNCVKGELSHYWNDFHDLCFLKTSSFSGVYNEFSTEERVEQYVALGKLIQLRDYWVGDWKINSDSLDNIYVVHNNKDKITEIDILYYENDSLTFPTKEMANEFIECFEDLIKKACPLV